MLVKSSSPPITNFFSKTPVGPCRAPKVNHKSKGVRNNPVKFKLPSTNDNKKKGSGKRLTEHQRLEIIRKIEQNNKINKSILAREYDVTEGSIRHTYVMKDMIKQRNADNPSFTRNRFTPAKHPEFEQQLHSWIITKRLDNISLPPSLIQNKAKDLAMKLSLDDFKCSPGWYSGFSKRFNLQTASLFGEGGDVDKNDPQLLESLNKLYGVISHYPPERVYNMDETGLFYKLIPRFTVLLKTEDVASTRGTKESKDRVTLTICANATGSHKLPLMMIGSAKEPACLRTANWPSGFDYINQKKSWQDQSTFLHWFLDVFCVEVRKRTQHPVLLILDNASSHKEPIVNNGVVVIFFPPNVTSWKQPCDQGIIAALKKVYKYNLLREVINYHDDTAEEKERLQLQAGRLRRGAAGLKYGKPAHLLDAATIVVNSWNAISASTIENCFRKADIIPSWRVSASKDHSESEHKSNSQKDASEDADIHGLLDDMIKLQLLSDDEVGQFQDELNQVLHMDDENNETFIEKLVEDFDLQQPNEAFHHHQPLEYDMNHDSFTGLDEFEHRISDDCNIPSNIKTLKQKLYDLEDQLLMLSLQPLDHCTLVPIQEHIDAVGLFMRHLTRMEKATLESEKMRTSAKQIQRTLFGYIKPLPTAVPIEENEESTKAPKKRESLLSDDTKDDTAKMLQRDPLNSKFNNDKQDHHFEMMDVDKSKVHIQQYTT